jgi:hypothetical protein
MCRPPPLRLSPCGSGRPKLAERTQWCLRLSPGERGRTRSVRAREKHCAHNIEQQNRRVSAISSCNRYCTGANTIGDTTSQKAVRPDSLKFSSPDMIARKSFSVRTRQRSLHESRFPSPIPDQDCGHGVSVTPHDITFVIISQRAIRLPWAVLRQTISPSANMRPRARQKHSIALWV